MHKRGEPCGSAPRVSVGRYRKRISNFQLIFLIALPASRAFIIAQKIIIAPPFYWNWQAACAVACRLHSPLEVGRVRQVKGEKQKICYKA